MRIQITDDKKIFFDHDEPHLENDGLIYTLNCVVQLFEKFFPKNKFHSLMILLDHNCKSPICYRCAQIIILKAEPFSWSQVAYQFSHEFCHYMIPNDVCENFRWFEESICELSSHFFLPLLSEQWIEQNISYTTDSGDLYANYFSSYAAENMTHNISFDIHSQEELLSLENNCYQREKNRYIAKLLFPIFKKHPLIWHAVPDLCRVSANQSFLNSLVEWISISPEESKAGLEEILQLFS